MDNPWNEGDVRAFDLRQWPVEEAERQQEQLVQGGVPVDAVAPCIQGDGFLV